MARITVEDCLDNVTNRFSLVRLASRRAKQILAGNTAIIKSKENKAVVTALREIATGRVIFTSEVENEVENIEAENLEPVTQQEEIADNEVDTPEPNTTTEEAAA